MPPRDLIPGAVKATAGEAFTLKRAAGASVSAVGVFGTEDRLLELGGEVPVAERSVTLGCLLADIDPVARGDVVEFANRAGSWTVQNVPLPDAKGWVRLGIELETAEA